MLEPLMNMRRDITSDILGLAWAQTLLPTLLLFLDEFLPSSFLHRTIIFGALQLLGLKTKAVLNQMLGVVEKCVHSSDVNPDAVAPVVVDAAIVCLHRICAMQLCDFI